MAIAKKPAKQNDQVHSKKEEQANAFIEEALRPNEIKEEETRQNKIPITMRFDVNLLKKIDAASRNRGVSRSSWIHYVISKAIESGDI